MNHRTLADTAKAMVSGDKGLLAMDESTGTCDRRFAAARHCADCGGAARL